MIYDYLTYNDNSFFVCNLEFFEILKNKYIDEIKGDRIEIDEFVVLEGKIGVLEIYCYEIVTMRNCIDAIYNHKNINKVEIFPVVIDKYIDAQEYKTNNYNIDLYKYNTPLLNLSLYVTNSNKCLNKMFPEDIKAKHVWEIFPDKLILLCDICDKLKWCVEIRNYLNILRLTLPHFNNDIDKIDNYLKNNINNKFIDTISEYIIVYKKCVRAKYELDEDPEFDNYFMNDGKNNLYIKSQEDYENFQKNNINIHVLLISRGPLHQFLSIFNNYSFKPNKENYSIIVDYVVKQLKIFLKNKKGEYYEYDTRVYTYFEQVLNNYIYKKLKKLHLQGNLDMYNMYYKKKPIDFFYGNVNGDPWLLRHNDDYFHFITEYNDLFCKCPIFMIGTHGMCETINRKGADIIQDIFTYECKNLINDFENIYEYNFLKYDKSIVLDKNNGIYIRVNDEEIDYETIHNAFDGDNDDLETKYINRIKYFGFWYYQNIFCDIEQLELNPVLIKNLIVCFKFYCKIIYVLYTEKEKIDMDDPTPTGFSDAIRDILNKKYDGFDKVYEIIEIILLSYIPENKKNTFSEYLKF